MKSKATTMQIKNIGRNRLPKKVTNRLGKPLILTDEQEREIILCDKMLVRADIITAGVHAALDPNSSLWQDREVCAEMLLEANTLRKNAFALREVNKC